MPHHTLREIPARKLPGVSMTLKQWVHDPFVLGRGPICKGSWRLQVLSLFDRFQIKPHYRGTMLPSFSQGVTLHGTRKGYLFASLPQEVPKNGCVFFSSSPKMVVFLLAPWKTTKRHTQMDGCPTKSQPVPLWETTMVTGVTWVVPCGFKGRATEQGMAIYPRANKQAGGTQSRTSTWQESP